MKYYLRSPHKLVVMKSLKIELWCPKSPYFSVIYKRNWKGGDSNEESHSIRVFCPDPDFSNTSSSANTKKSAWPGIADF